MNDKLVEKVNNIDISGLVPKTKYDADKSDLEKKVPDTSGLVKKTDCNTKSTEIEKKIPSISGLATNSALTALEDKIPNVSNLVKKKTDYDTKITETEKKKLIDNDYDKHITTPEFNSFYFKISTSRFNNKDRKTKKSQLKN